MENVTFTLKITGIPKKAFDGAVADYIKKIKKEKGIDLKIGAETTVSFDEIIEISPKIFIDIMSTAIALESGKQF